MTRALRLSRIALGLGCAAALGLLAVNLWIGDQEAAWLNLFIFILAWTALRSGRS